MAATTATASAPVAATPDSEDRLAGAIGAFAERVFLAAVGAFELATVELGTRLGLYQALAEGPASGPELARRAGIDARYAREWLEQQATAGIVEIAEDSDDADARRFTLPDAHGACLLDPDSLAFVAPLATFGTAGPAIVPELVSAYREGRGLSFAEYGDGIREAQELANRPQFRNLLAAEWLPAMPDVVQTLSASPSRVLDVGCGSGWSSIVMAQAYPQTEVVGFDTDDASVRAAARNAKIEGVTGRVQFVDRADAIDGRFDLACCFEALHDVAHPVALLRFMRESLSPAGAVLVVDDRVADALTANDPDPTQRLFYAASVLHCLPVGRSEDGSAATGTMMRPAILERYAEEAGYSSVEILPVEHDMFRLYRLHP